MIHLSRSILRGSLATIGAAAALAAMAAPALAATGGTGGSGTLTTDLTFVSHPQPDCATANSGFGATTSFSSAEITSGSASYVGPLTLTWTVDQTNGPWYEGPDGTYGNHNSACAQSAYGDAWEISGTATGTNAQGSTVTCTFASGDGSTYSRTNNTAVVVQLEGTCDIQEAGTDGSDFVDDGPTSITLTTTVGTCYDTTMPADFIPEYCDTTDSFI
ncbi:MAG: hypothetical protein ABIY58_15180 [Acidimicrobiales bacterium]